MFSLTFFNFLMLSSMSYFSENKPSLFKNSVGMVGVISLVGLSFMCKNPVLFLIFLELSVMPTSILILSLSKDEDKLISVMMMMMINLMGSLPFILYSSWFVFSFEDSWVLLLSGCDSVVIFYMFLLVFCSKLPLAMFHFWLTKAHVAASACISMILASILLKLGSFGMFKFMPMFLENSLSLVENFLSWCIMFCLMFSFNMIRYVDMKMLVAVSSILHMGMMLPLLSLNSSFGCLSMLLMMLGHGMVSYFLFMLVSVMYETSLSRSSNYNKSSDSFSSGLSLMLFSLSFLNIGVPPLINFLSEVGICSMLSCYSVCGLLPFSSVMLLSIFFCMFLVTKSFFGRKMSFCHQEIESSLLSFNWMFFLVLLLYPLFF